MLGLKLNYVSKRGYWSIRMIGMHKSRRPPNIYARYKFTHTYVSYEFAIAYCLHSYLVYIRR